MGLITLPKLLHPDFTSPKRKPLGPVQIDWEHPLTRRKKLVFYCIDNIDYVSGRIGRPKIDFSPDSSARAPSGDMQSFASAKGGWEFTHCPELLRLDGQPLCTMAFRIFSTIDQFRGRVNSMPFDPSSTSNPESNVSIGIGNATNGEFRFHTTGSGSPSAVGTSGNWIPTDKVFRTYGVTKNTTTTVNFYRDGVIFESPTTGTAGNNLVFSGTDVSTMFIFGLNRSTIWGIQGVHKVTAWWAEELNASDHAQFNANPYALLKPRIPISYHPTFSVVGGPGAGAGDQVRGKHGRTGLRRF